MESTGDYWKGVYYLLEVEGFERLLAAQFSKWLASEGETPTDDLLGLAPPKLDTKIIRPAHRRGAT